MSFFIPFPLLKIEFSPDEIKLTSSVEKRIISTCMIKSLAGFLAVGITECIIRTEE